MVNYLCEKCNKNFDKKSNYINHTQHKKRPCSTQNKIIILESIDTNYKLSEVPHKISEVAQKSSEVPHKISEITPKFSEVPSEILNCSSINNLSNTNNSTNINSSVINQIMCLYCNTSFTRNDNLQRHLNNYCKSKKYCDELEKLKEKFKSMADENELLKKENNELKHTHTDNNQTINNINNTNNILNKNHILNKNQINNGTVNNNNVNIVQLVQFGNENMDDIDIKEAFNTYLSSTGGNIVSNVLKLTNFNKKYPENHNICITDLSRELVKIYNGSKFITKKYKNVKGDILNKIVKNTRKIVDKIENDKMIKKSQDVQSKMKINGVSLKLIDGQSAEDIVKDEVIEKNKLLMIDSKEIKTKKNNSDEIDYENSDTDSELEDDIEFNLEERLRIKYLENKQNGLINIAHERIKDELYNNRTLI